MTLKKNQKSKIKPIVNFDNKVGRNEPCPCGSKKKFKLCCMKNNPKSLHELLEGI
jgi:preprotein translocase subunit SecA